ncbi:hypothetical protein [Dactylosporangium sp. NPDC000521]|uniref:hypothetical protein n=1 Tax=Dactylosporangium sp. NPDC000521 TaxID=3363975 RepID=UPI0036A59FB1
MATVARRRPEIVVGLVATPPDHPAKVVARLAAELTDRLAERVDAEVHWTVGCRDGPLRSPGPSRFSGLTSANGTRAYCA